MFWSRRALQVRVHRDLCQVVQLSFFSSSNFAHRSPRQPVKARQPLLAVILGATMMLLNGLFGVTMFVNNSESLPPMPCWVNEFCGIATFMAQSLLYMLRYVCVGYCAPV